MSERIARKVLWIGWDAADWKFITPLLESGQMPNLAKLISQGVMGNIATLRPILSPILWNTIATGKRAHKHGIFGFTEPTPDGSGVQPVSSTTRKCKAIWNILTQAGLKTHVTGWFASHPAEPISGVCVANNFPKPPRDIGAAWPKNAGGVHPERVAASLAELRVRGEEIGADEAGPFMPSGAEIDQTKKGGVNAIRNFAWALAELINVHNCFTWSLENEPWDFAAVYYEAIDHFGHHFMAFHPPQMAGTSDAEFKAFKGVMTGVYRYHDMMLGSLLAHTDDDTLVILNSDHGFYSDHLRPPIRNGKMAGPVTWHRPHGVLVMKGPGIRQDERIYGATILDLVPTILAALGLPVGNDMDGKVLAAAFKNAPTVNRIESWETVPGEAGMHPPDMRQDPLEAHEALQQLIDLGYIEDSAGDMKKSIEITTNELKFNAAVSYLDVNEYPKSIELFEQLVANKPDELRYVMGLAGACFESGAYERVRTILKPFDGQRLAAADMLLGQVFAAEGDLDTAMSHLERAEKSQPRVPKLNLELGALLVRRGNWDDAIAAFHRALAIDGDNPFAYHGLAVAHGRKHDYAQAAEYALRAVGLRHFYPAGHFQLGAMLAKLNEPERAATCFEIGLQMQPHSLIAHRYLARLYKRLGDIEKANHHRAASEQLMRTVQPPKRSIRATSSAT